MPALAADLDARRRDGLPLRSLHTELPLTLKRRSVCSDTMLRISSSSCDEMPKS